MTQIIEITPALLEAVAGKPISNLVDRPLSAAYNKILPKYGITTPKRVAHFLSQIAHETDGFVAFIERGNGDGPDPDPFDDYLQRYDFRKDLGNSKPGDGELYRGRGGLHHTGAANYKILSEKIGVDFVKEPWKLAEPEYFVQADCIYWSQRGLNTFADQDDARGITYRINGGYNGINNRLMCLRRAKRFLGI